VVGTTAYVADWEAGLQILDVSNPTNVVHLGGYDTSGWALNVQVAGTTAYVADYDSGLQILDVSDPAKVVRLGGYYTRGNASGVQVVGTTAYVVHYYAGLQILDVSNPRNVVRLGGYDTSCYARGAQVVGTTVYVADGEWGLAILGLSGSVAPRPELRFLGTGTSAQLEITGAAGLTCILEATLSLNAPLPWEPMGELTLTAAPQTWAITNTAAPARFFRARLKP